ncbi:hypothetical protein BCR43DRAFT_484560 [Syncephalastrum racemosum]|uniref:MYND-type domain-containing protein n=1 Tax=Syncephalastrum racemosum TaxID=13706 RepID=A0A1X2HKS6_SYNRA|nr:hypothetical protein BCR43DRAFT_484560 [Syncephalastrum racemosum]
MREPNYSFPSQNRAAVVISSALYDRRALDCTATLPLVNSLTHLAYMTSTSPRIREILAADGGLERLVKILSTCQQSDRHSLWKWSLAFQCVVNVGVRGTEAIRSRVVETGAVHVVLAVLENFLRALEQAKTDKEQENRKQQQQQQQQQSLGQVATALTLPTVPLQPTQSRSTPITPSRRLIGHLAPFDQYNNTNNNNENTTTTTTNNNNNTTNNNTNDNNQPTLPSEQQQPLQHLSHPQGLRAHVHQLQQRQQQQQREQQELQERPESPSFTLPKRRTFLTRTPRSKPKPQAHSLTSIPLLNNLSPDAILHREEDVLLSLQLLAYLSKYPHLRESFHKNHSRNVFSVVERFTHRLHPQAIIYWAGVIMRNACRKDEARGGIRQCAYMHCGKWERYPREFAKCRRCRKAKYCSKSCQSKAWAEGHRWWCIERHHSTHPPNATTTSSTTAAATAAVVAAAPDTTTPQTNQVVPLATHGTTADVLPIPIDERQSDLPQGQQQQQQQQQDPAAAPQTNEHSTETVESEENRHMAFNNNASSDTDSNTHTPHHQDSSLLRSGHHHHHHHHHRRRNSRTAPSVPSGSSTEVETEITDNNVMRDLMDID